MPTKRTDETSVRKLTKVGKHSLAVTIPIEIVRKLKLRERQKVVVRERGGTITIIDWKG